MDHGYMQQLRKTSTFGKNMTNDTGIMSTSEVASCPPYSCSCDQGLSAIGHQSHVTVWLSALLYGAATAIFFKKSFQRSSVPLLANMVAVGLLIQSSLVAVQTPWTVALQIWSVATCLVLPIKLNVVAAKDMTSVLLFYVMFLELQLDILGPPWHCFLTMLGAVPQFIRRPHWLKAKLQKLRSKLGPMYVAYVTAFSLPLAGATGRDTWFGHVMSVMAGVAMVTAIMAAVIYRPDNSEILGLFFGGSKASYRKGVHRTLMITSLVCFLVNVWYLYF